MTNTCAVAAFQIDDAPDSPNLTSACVAAEAYPLDGASEGLPIATAPGRLLIVAEDRSWYVADARCLYVPVPLQTRQQVLNNMIVFRSIQQADALCRLNGWDSLKLQLNALELGLRFRQPNVVRPALFNLSPEQRGVGCTMILDFVRSSRLVAADSFEETLVQIAMSFLCGTVAEAEAELTELLESWAAHGAPSVAQYLRLAPASLTSGDDDQPRSLRLFHAASSAESGLMQRTDAAYRQMEAYSLLLEQFRAHRARLMDAKASDEDEGYVFSARAAVASPTRGIPARAQATRRAESVDMRRRTTHLHRPADVVTLDDLLLDDSPAVARDGVSGALALSHTHVVMEDLGTDSLPGSFSGVGGGFPGDGPESPLDAGDTDSGESSAGSLPLSGHSTGSSSPVSRAVLGAVASHSDAKWGHFNETEIIRDALIRGELSSAVAYLRMRHTASVEGHRGDLSRLAWTANDWLRFVRERGFALCYQALCAGQVALAVCVLGQLCENVTAGLQEVYVATKRRGLRGQIGTQLAAMAPIAQEADFAVPVDDERFLGVLEAAYGNSSYAVELAALRAAGVRSFDESLSSVFQLSGRGDHIAASRGASAAARVFRSAAAATADPGDFGAATVDLAALCGDIDDVLADAAERHHIRLSDLGASAHIARAVVLPSSLGVGAGIGAGSASLGGGGGGNVTSGASVHRVVISPPAEGSTAAAGGAGPRGYAHVSLKMVAQWDAATRRRLLLEAAERGAAVDVDGLGADELLLLRYFSDHASWRDVVKYVRSFASATLSVALYYGNADGAASEDGSRMAQPCVDVLRAYAPGYVDWLALRELSRSGLVYGGRAASDLLLAACQEDQVFVLSSRPLSVQFVRSSGELGELGRLFVTTCAANDWMPILSTFFFARSGAVASPATLDLMLNAVPAGSPDFKRWLYVMLHMRDWQRDGWAQAMVHAAMALSRSSRPPAEYVADCADFARAAAVLLSNNRALAVLALLCLDRGVESISEAAWLEDHTALYAALERENPQFAELMRVDSAAAARADSGGAAVQQAAWVAAADDRGGAASDISTAAGDVTLHQLLGEGRSAFDAAAVARLASLPLAEAVPLGDTSISQQDDEVIDLAFHILGGRPTEAYSLLLSHPSVAVHVPLMVAEALEPEPQAPLSLVHLDVDSRGQNPRSRRFELTPDENLFLHRYCLACVATRALDDASVASAAQFLFLCGVDADGFLADVRCARMLHGAGGPDAMLEACRAVDAATAKAPVQSAAFAARVEAAIEGSTALAAAAAQAPRSAALPELHVWSPLFDFCRSRGLPAPQAFLRKLAARGDWLGLLMVAQSKELAPADLKGALASLESDSLRGHLRVVLDPGGAIEPGGEQSHASGRAILQRVLDATRSPSPVIDLVRAAVSERAPVLAVVAAHMQDVASEESVAHNGRAVGDIATSAKADAAAPWRPAVAYLLADLRQSLGRWDRVSPEYITDISALVDSLYALDALAWKPEHLHELLVLLCRNGLGLLLVVRLVDLLHPKHPFSRLLMFCQYFAQSRYAEAGRSLDAFVGEVTRAERDGSADIGGGASYAHVRATQPQSLNPHGAAARSIAVSPLWNHDLDAAWYRQLAVSVVDHLLHLAGSFYECGHLLEIASTSSLVPRYSQMFRTLVLLRRSGLPMSLIHSPPTEVLDVMVARGLFEDARSMALQNALDYHSITMKEVAEMERRFQEGYLNSVEFERVNLWLQCNELLQERQCTAEISGSYFLSQSRRALYLSEQRTLQLLAYAWFAGLGGMLDSIDSMGRSDSSAVTAGAGGGASLPAPARSPVTPKLQRLADSAQAGAPKNSGAGSYGGASIGSLTVGSLSGIGGSLRSVGSPMGGAVPQRTPNAVRPAEFLQELECFVLLTTAALEGEVGDYGFAVSGAQVQKPLPLPEVGQPLPAELEHYVERVVVRFLDASALEDAAWFVRCLHLRSPSLEVAQAALSVANGTPTAALAPDLRQRLDAAGLALGESALYAFVRLSVARSYCERLLLLERVAASLASTFAAVSARDPLDTLHLLLRSGRSALLLTEEYIRRLRLPPSRVAAVVADYVHSIATAGRGASASAAASPSVPYASTPVSSVIAQSQSLSVSSSAVASASASALSAAIAASAQSPRGEDLTDEYFVELMRVCNAAADIGYRLLSLVGEVRSQRTWPIDVELLVRAYQCFTQAAARDGVEAVLRQLEERLPLFIRVRDVNLLTRILAGVRAYQRLQGIFDYFLSSDSFELLLQRNLRSAGPEYRAALAGYMLAKHPDKPAKLRMMFLAFNMNRELGDYLAQEAARTVRAVSAAAPASSAAAVSALLSVCRDAVSLLLDTAENFLKARSYRLAHEHRAMAALVLLQTRCPAARVVGLGAADAQALLFSTAKFDDALVIAAAYRMRSLPVWVRAAYRQVVEHGNFAWLDAYVAAFPCAKDFYGEVARMHRADAARVQRGPNFVRLLATLPDRFAAYDIALENDLPALAAEIYEATEGLEYFRPPPPGSASSNSAAAAAASVSAK
jgi:hypothetical protein